jgi:hydroxymethylpyrimidine/phosphomethylpyrimidine kinase
MGSERAILVSMQTVLSIAGFDPSSGAGVTADLMVFAAHGLFGTSAITSLTVQSTVGVRSSEPVSSRILTDTLDCLHSDLPPAGVKIGMLGTAAIVDVVADYIARLRALSSQIPIVLDPVLRSSSGRELLAPEGIVLLRERLLPQVTWITPNTDELSVLTGQRIETPEQVVSAASSLQQAYPAMNVLVTGGHLEKPDDLLLAVSTEPQWIRGEHIESRSTHGTGCAFSSALLSRLVMGEEPHEAAVRGKEYVAEAIRRAVPLGYGNGPLNHLWPLR